MLGLLGFYTIYLLTIKNILLNIKVAEKDLNNFLKKIEQLNKLSQFIKKNPAKKKELSNCSNHDEVILLTSKWGFEIGKRWGEN